MALTTYVTSAKGLNCTALRHGARRNYFTSGLCQVDATLVVPTVFAARANERARQTAENRDLMLDVLSSTATKREAKSYLSRFNTPKGLAEDSETSQGDPLQRTGVNLGSLFQRPHAIDTSPQFRQFPANQSVAYQAASQFHAAIVVIRSAAAIADAVLEGVGHILAQLSRLGLHCIVVVDDEARPEERHRTQQLLKQVDRVIDAIEKGKTVRARRLDSLFYKHGEEDSAGVELSKSSHIYEAFRRDLVPVIAPLIYDDAQRCLCVDANGAALALCSAFREGLASRRRFKQAERVTEASSTQHEVQLDRVIILDPRGGIPQTKLGGSHVFINLEQEYSSISNELRALLRTKSENEANNPRNGGQQAYTSGPQTVSEDVAAAAVVLADREIQGHLANLALARGTLAMLPNTSSALITTPLAASNSAGLPKSLKTTAVGTRPHRNPLIHSLLTDKPIFSSSLPKTRLSAVGTTHAPTNHPSIFQAPPTHLKHGMPVTIVPDPLRKPWSPPADVNFSLSLEDSRIDIPRLIHLIEDSFGRPLDQDHYLSRIRPLLAGIIIAGDYEGGAILTWEQPSSPSRYSIPTSTPPNPQRLVPYLDKFAVLKRSQGAGGVADVVFSAMVRRCFPHGVCWRSRSNNPVNKWYFERSRGTYRLPLVEPGGQGWTMFWTTENLTPERFNEYANVCMGVQSSWADRKETLD